MKKSHLQSPLIPNPEFYGWIKVDGILKPHWFDGEELPLQLKDFEVTMRVIVKIKSVMLNQILCTIVKMNIII